VGDRFYSYYNTDYPFIAHGVEKLSETYSPEELALFERMLKDLNGALE
jgi:hypothetical protein